MGYRSSSLKSVSRLTPMEETAYTKCLVNQASAYVTREHTASIFLLKRLDRRREEAISYQVYGMLRKARL